MPELRGYWGDHTFTTMGRRPTRFVDEEEGCVVGGEYFTHMAELELRNPYIDACNGGKVRSRWSQRDHDALEEVRGHLIPHYRKAGMPTVPVVGIDIDQTYAALGQRFSTQVEYSPAHGAWLPFGEPWQDLETVRPLKQLYATVFTVARSKRFGCRWDRGVPMETKNPYYQPQAFRLVSDYLMSWAMEAIGLFDVWFVNNDCYGLEEHQAAEFFEFMASRWGMAAKVERRWEPGQEWPWPVCRHPQANVRPIPDLVRQRLAWAFTAEGPLDGRMTARWDPEARDLVFTLPPPPVEPPPLPWQARRGLSRWELVHVELPFRFVWRHGAEPRQHTYEHHFARADHEPEESEEWVEPERGPPGLHGQRGLRGSSSTGQRTRPPFEALRAALHGHR